MILFRNGVIPYTIKGKYFLKLPCGELIKLTIDEYKLLLDFYKICYNKKG